MPVLSPANNNQFGYDEQHAYIPIFMSEKFCCKGYPAHNNHASVHLIACIKKD